MSNSKKFILVFVSRDYQVRGYLKLYKYLQGAYNLPYFISLDQYIPGNSLDYLREIGYTEFEPMYYNSKEGVFLNFIKSYKRVLSLSHEKNGLVFVDQDVSYHLNHVILLSLRRSWSIVFFQHGYSWYPNLTFDWEKGWVKNSRQHEFIRRVKVFFLYSYFHFIYLPGLLNSFIDLISSYRLRQIFLRSSLNFVYYYDILKVMGKSMNERTFSFGSIFYSNSSLIDFRLHNNEKAKQRFIIFSTGALRSNSVTARLRLVRYINLIITLLRSYEIIIKVKPGERLDLSSEYDNITITNEISFGSSDFRDILILPADSNSCIEAMQQGYTFYTYNIYETESAISKINKELGALDFFQHFKIGTPLSYNLQSLNILRRYNIITNYEVSQKIAHTIREKI